MLNKRLFHGTDKDLAVLEPLGIDMGFSFQKPKWAIFFWEEFQLAFLWSLFQTIRRKKLFKVLYHIPTGKPLIDERFKKDAYQVVGSMLYVYEKTLTIGDYRYDRDQLRHKYIKLIEAGELKYGDDLSKVSLENLPASYRW